MNILIITAHPGNKNLTKHIANEYETTKKSKGHTVQTIDLYSKKFSIPFLYFDKITNLKPCKVTLDSQELIRWADEIVFVHPIWWGLPPAIMKNWLDSVFWHGFAFRYKENGKVEGMLQGKTAKIFATSGGPAWIHSFFFMPLKSFWKNAILEFSGIEVIDFQVCGNLDSTKDQTWEADHVKKFINKVRKSGND